MLRLCILLVSLSLSVGLFALFGWAALVACFGLCLLTLISCADSDLEPTPVAQSGFMPSPVHKRQA